MRLIPNTTFCRSLSLLIGVGVEAAAPVAPAGVVAGVTSFDPGLLILITRGSMGADVTVTAAPVDTDLAVMGVTTLRLALSAAAPGSIGPIMGEGRAVAGVTVEVGRTVVAVGCTTMRLGIGVPMSVIDLPATVPSYTYILYMNRLLDYLSLFQKKVPHQKLSDGNPR